MLKKLLFLVPVLSLIISCASQQEVDNTDSLSNNELSNIEKYIFPKDRFDKVYAYVGDGAVFQELVYVYEQDGYIIQETYKPFGSGGVVRETFSIDGNTLRKIDQKGIFFFREEYIDEETRNSADFIVENNDVFDFRSSDYDPALNTSFTSSEKLVDSKESIFTLNDFSGPGLELNYDLENRAENEEYGQDIETGVKSELYLQDIGLVGRRSVWDGVWVAYIWLDKIMTLEEYLDSRTSYRVQRPSNEKKK